MLDFNALQQLSQLLSPEDASLTKEVLQSAIMPNDYIKQFADKLLQRGIVKPINSLPWIALVDGLQRRKRLIELDWKEYPDRFITVVSELLPEVEAGQKAREALHSLKAQDDEQPYEILHRIDKVLHAYNFSLMIIDINADCYPLCIIPQKDYDSAEKLAQKAGYGQLYSSM